MCSWILNKAILEQWISKGIAEIKPDSAWYWTELGLKLFNPYVRSIMANKLYGQALPDFFRVTAMASGFDPDTGFYKEE